MADNRSQIVADADSVDLGADYQNGSNQGPRTPLGFELSQAGESSAAERLKCRRNQQLMALPGDPRPYA